MELVSCIAYRLSLIAYRLFRMRNKCLMGTYTSFSCVPAVCPTEQPIIWDQNLAPSRHHSLCGRAIYIWFWKLSPRQFALMVEWWCLGSARPAPNWPISGELPLSLHQHTFFQQSDWLRRCPGTPGVVSVTGAGGHTGQWSAVAALHVPLANGYKLCEGKLCVIQSFFSQIPEVLIFNYRWVMAFRDTIGVWQSNIGGKFSLPSLVVA